MATTTNKSQKRPVSKASVSRIQSAYIDYMLNNGNRPASVFKFCGDIGIKEDEFYDHFGSFEGLERSIWKSFIDTTIERLHADASYAGFSAREKLLAFYYTFFEELKSSRSFILVQLQNYRKIEFTPDFLKDFKTAYENYVEATLKTGKASGEIATRPLLDKRYPQLFWFHMGFMLIFWKDDNSAGFQKTDAAIEKSVNLAFDLIGKGAVDSAIDFAKFLYQTKVN